MLPNSSYASAAKDRLTGLISHLTPQGKGALTAQNPDDVVICAAVRTPITRAKKGGFKDTCPEDLLVAVFKGVVERSGIDKNLVEEIQVGNVLPPGGGATVARMAQLAGMSLFLSLVSTNRGRSSLFADWCSRFPFDFFDRYRQPTMLFRFDRRQPHRPSDRRWSNRCRYRSWCREYDDGLRCRCHARKSAPSFASFTLYRPTDSSTYSCSSPSLFSRTTLLPTASSPWVSRVSSRAIVAITE